jgi:RimJ/RimL family protein N-acetyltransferase
VSTTASRNPARTLADVWPLAGLRLTVDRSVTDAGASQPVELRPIEEADLPALAEVFPTDVEVNPAMYRFDLGTERAARAVIVCQEYWRAVGTWRPDAWVLPFAVRVSDRLVGVQVLEGTDFPTLRTVDSASWLAPEERGRGVGRAMRTAVLALAFGPLRARVAITSAWHDNGPSLGVSRGLGYRPNGESLDRRGDGADVMVHLRLTRQDWLQRAAGSAVSIDGFEPCRPLFGL